MDQEKLSAEALYHENIIGFVDTILELYEKCAVPGEDMGEPRVVGLNQNCPEFEEFAWQMEMLRHYRRAA